MISNPLNFEQRIRGGIYGGLVGDALGVPVEFSGRLDRDKDPVTDMRGGGMWRQLPGTWSDDGSMLLCTAEACVGDFSLSRFGRLYVEWMRSGYWAARGEVFDIGGTTERALSALADGVPIESVGETSEDANGNGSLMRTLPLGLRYAHHDRRLLIDRAMSVSAITHAHPRARVACAIYCVIVAGIAHGLDVTAATKSAAAHCQPLWSTFPGEQGWFARIFDGRLFDLSRNELNSTGYVIDTLESSLWCVRHHHDFESTVLAAVNLGGDADTTGCVAGGLAGVLYGMYAIPQPWLGVLPNRQSVDALVEQFVSASHEPA